MKRIEVPEAHAGDIVGLTGFEDVFIGETICDSEARAALPYIPIDPPTIQMEFAVNDGPLAGQDGKLVTARHIWDRLVKEIRTNVALRIAQTERSQRSSRSAAAAKCRSPFSSSRCAAKVTKCWSRARKCSGRKTPTAMLLEPIEKLFVEIPKRKPGRDHGESCRPQGADHEHESSWAIRFPSRRWCRCAA